MSGVYKFVVPQPGLIVRMPENMAAIPESGATVPWIGPEGRYWRKQARNNAITVFDEPPHSEAQVANKKRVRKED